MMSSQENKEPVLSEAGGLDAYNLVNLHLRVADYYKSISKEDPSKWKSMDDLMPQLLEFGHRVHAKDYERAYRVLEQIAFHLFLWGYYDRLVEMRKVLLDDRLTDPGSQAANLNNLGFAYVFLQKSDQAKDSFENALDIARKSKDRQNEGTSLSYLGLVYGLEGKIKPALGHCVKALVIALETGDFQLQSLTLNRMGLACHSHAGEYERIRIYYDWAIAFYKKALPITREINDRQTLCGSLSTLSRAYQDLGQFDEAMEYSEEALTIAREIGDIFVQQIVLGDRSSIYFHLATTYRERGQVEQALAFYQQAIAFCEQALAIADKIGDIKGKGIQSRRLARLYYSLGRYYEEKGDEQRANEHFEWAKHYRKDIKDTFEKVEDHRRESHHLLGLGITLLGQGDKAAAEDALAGAIKYCEDILKEKPTSCETRSVLRIALEALAACKEDEGERAELRNQAQKEKEEADKCQQAALSTAMSELSAGLAELPPAARHVLPVEVQDVLPDSQEALLAWSPDKLSPEVTEQWQKLALDVSSEALHTLKQMQEAGVEKLESDIEKLESEVQETTLPRLIYDLNLEKQTSTVLKKAGIYTVEQLRGKSDEDLKAIPGIKDKRLSELKDSLDKLG